MNTVLIAINNGLTNNHWDEADACFLAAAILGALAAIAYAAGIGTVARPELGPEHPDDATTTTPTGPHTATRPIGLRNYGPSPARAWTRDTWHYRFHEIAAALLSLAVASVGFGLFLQ